MTEKNKFYTKWWFWAIIGVVILGVIINFSSNSSTDSTDLDTNKDSIKDTKSSLTNPLPIGESLTTTFGYGQLVTAEYSVLEIIRGEEAWNRIKSANQFNSQPDEGKEYLLAKIKFYLIETSDGKSYSIPHTIFSVFSNGGLSYDYQSVIEPEPRLLNKELYPGAIYEGWIAYQIPIEEDEPRLRVSYLDEGEIFFKLYPPTSTGVEEPFSSDAPQQQDFLSELQQREESPWFVPSLITEKCNLVLSDLNVKIVKDNVNYKGTSTISGKLTNTNSVPMFNVDISYGLYNDKGVSLTKGTYLLGMITDYSKEEISPGETISFSEEETDLSAPGEIYNAFAYKINVYGKEPNLDAQYCPFNVGYVKVF